MAAPMDNTAQLAQDLQEKLKELNDRVVSYTQEIASEFQRYSKHTLHNVPLDTCRKVSRIVKERMFDEIDDEDSTNSSSDESPDPPPTGRKPWFWRYRGGRDGRRSPPPILHHTSGKPKAAFLYRAYAKGGGPSAFIPLALRALDQTAHDDHEDGKHVGGGPGEDTIFHQNQNHGDHGPSSNNNNKSGMNNTRSSRSKQGDGIKHDSPCQPTSPTIPPSTSSCSTTSTLLPLSTSSILSIKSTLDETQSTQSPQSLRAQQSEFPPIQRRLTDTTSSSLDSISTKLKIRRSALRRTSSPNKGSPRRVRFEVEGIEVLPTTSPQATSLANLSEATEDRTSAIFGGSPTYAVMSLLDVPGEEDTVASLEKLTPRVSSSQTLRALSRAPLDEGTVWKVINPDPYDLGTPSTTTITATAKSKSLADLLTAATKVSGNDAAKKPVASPEVPALPPSPSASHHDSSDEEFLSMGPKRSNKASQAAPQVPTTQAVMLHRPEAGMTAAAADRLPPLPPVAPAPLEKEKGVASPLAMEDEVDGVFDFEDDEGLTMAPSRVSRVKYALQEEPEVTASKSRSRKPQSIVSSSLTSPMSVPTSDQSPRAGPSKRSASVSIGTFKGAPMRLEVLNPELLRKLDATYIPHFVGSVDGRSGPDSSDVSNYLATLYKPRTGSPRSFTERLAHENAYERGLRALPRLLRRERDREMAANAANAAAVAHKKAKEREEQAMKTPKDTSANEHTTDSLTDDHETGSASNITTTGARVSPNNAPVSSPKAKPSDSFNGSR